MNLQETLLVRVLDKRAEAEGIAGFELAPVDGAALPPFDPGAHIDVHLPDGLVRQYSLCNPAHEQHRYRIAVLRDSASRGGSAAMHDAVHQGDMLRIGRPRNRFALHPARHSLLLAGGIGITPLLCMADRLLRTGADFALHYCTRSLARTAFTAEIAAAPLARYVHWHCDAAAQQLDLGAVLAAPDPGKRLYLCGPTGFIDRVLDTARGLGWAQERIHLEHFGAAAQQRPDEQGFDVRIASTGKTYAVAPGTSVVQALREQGIHILTACERGMCGTCLTRVLEGRVEHRDSYLTDAERAGNGQFLPCCSRARSRLLVLDL